MKKADWNEKEEELFKLFSNTKDDDELFRKVLFWHKKHCSQELKTQREKMGKALKKEILPLGKKGEKKLDSWIGFNLAVSQFRQAIIRYLKEKEQK